MQNMSFPRSLSLSASTSCRISRLKCNIFAIASYEDTKTTMKESKLQQMRSLEGLSLPSFMRVSKERNVSPYKRGAVHTLQLNIGLYCNQACSHCHVESSPLRTEMMDRKTAEKCVELMRSSEALRVVDLTGGAPELNKEFRFLVEHASALDLEVIDRCNLTVLLEPGQETLGQFLADHKVRVVASLPCYSEDNVDKQRGRGVFGKSILGLQVLNSLGYGQPGSGLLLDLVYNPGGAFLAPPQAKLEVQYREQLREAYGIEFNSLLALNNMPIKRFADWLAKENKMEEYMQLLVQNFNPSAAEAVMCRDTLSVGWDGAIYDCDFNQQLGMSMSDLAPSGQPARSLPHSQILSSDLASDLGQREVGSTDHTGSSVRHPGLTVFNLESLDQIYGRQILLGNHCYGCTAGAGSSCQGAVS